MIPVFIDTETTGLRRGYRPWEIALLRREADGTESEITIFIDVDDLDLANAEDSALAVGRFEARHPQRGGALGPNQVLLAGADAAREVQQRTAGAQLFGINTGYDVTALDGLLGRHGLDAQWFYVSEDLLSLGRGYLLGRGDQCPPRSSERLSTACGVEVPSSADRHTAMGDARWAARWYDRLCVGGSPEVAA